MNDKKIGLFTPYTLKFHADYYNESSVNFLKRSFIIFDEMAYIAPRRKDDGFLEKVINFSNVQKDVLSAFKPIKEFVDEEYISDISFQVMPESNMYYGPNRDLFMNFIKDFIKKKFDFDPNNYKTKNEFEILDYYTSALSADVNYLFQISKKLPEVSALYTELHKDAYLATYSEKTVSPESLLKSIGAVNYFDFSQLSWDQIIELKQSRFLEDFRVKFSEWLIELESSNNSLLFEQKIDKYIKEANFNFLRQKKPLTRINVLSRVIENIPTVVPNPLAVYNALSQTVNDFQTEEEFGWMFFIQEAFHKATPLR